MSQADQHKWDSRYRAGSYGERLHPSALLKSWLPRISRPADSPRAIDLACGLGRNAIYLAQQGWLVDALDISPVALGLLQARVSELRLPISCQQTDLDQWNAQGGPPGQRRYDLALLVRYADLSLVETLGEILNPGGYFLAEKHLVTPEKVVGPSGAEFRVQPGELRFACRNLHILWYAEGILDDPDGRRVALARVVARRSLV